MSATSLGQNFSVVYNYSVVSYITVNDAFKRLATPLHIREALDSNFDPEIVFLKRGV
jgi:hypothetical protein